MGWFEEKWEKGKEKVGKRVKSATGYLEDTIGKGADFYETVGQSGRDILEGDVSGALKRLYHEGIQTDLEGMAADWFSMFTGVIDPSAADALHDNLDEWGVEYAALAAAAFFGGPAVFAAAGGGIAGGLAATGAGLAVTGGILEYKESKEREKAELSHLDRLKETATENARRQVQNLMTEFEDAEEQQINELHGTQLFSGGIKQGTGTADFLALNRERARKMATDILKEGQREAEDADARKREVSRSEEFRRTTGILNTATRVAEPIISSSLRNNNANQES